MLFFLVDLCGFWWVLFGPILAPVRPLLAPIVPISTPSRQLDGLRAVPEAVHPIRPRRSNELQQLRRNLPSPRIGNTNYNFYLVFGHFPAEVGPETRSNGPGSTNGAERTQNQGTPEGPGGPLPGPGQARRGSPGPGGAPEGPPEGPSGF